MRCPACGNDESDRDVCSQCHTSLVPAEDSHDFEEEEVPSPSPSKRPAAPPVSSSKKTPAPPSKEGKHRPRPLHDLDLTLPELEVQPLPTPKARSEKSSARQSVPSKEKKHPVAGGPSSSPSFEKPRPSQPPSSKASGPPPRAQKSPDRNSPAGESSLDFSSYILSISTAALMALGGAKMPGMPSSPGTGPKDIAQGKELIDLLMMLEEKTEGNLTNSESELLKQSLQNLRTKLAQAIKGT